MVGPLERLPEGMTSVDGGYPYAWYVLKQSEMAYNLTHVKRALR
jgi:hypothetical protein